MPNSRKRKGGQNRPRRWSERQLDIIFQNSKGRCRECKRRHRRNGHPQEWTVDHIYPQSAGRFDDFANLAVNCVKCNSRKGGQHTIFDNMEVMSNSIGESMNSGDPRRRNWL